MIPIQFKVDEFYQKKQIEKENLKSWRQKKKNYTIFNDLFLNSKKLIFIYFNLLLFYIKNILFIFQALMKIVVIC